MNGFSIEVVVYGLEFSKYIIGTREDYSNEDIKKIKQEYIAAIKTKLSLMGFIRIA